MMVPFDKRVIEFAIIDFSETLTISRKDLDKYRLGILELLQVIEDRFKKGLYKESA